MSGAIVFIPLTQGKVAIVDFDDFEKVRGHKWHAHKTASLFYAETNTRKLDGSRTLLKMHRLLLPGPKQVDHINGDGLDNRRANIRASTQAENTRAFKRKRANASSKYRGVGWKKTSQKWQAQIEWGGKNKHLGYFKNEEDAARAYDVSARKFFGEFASPNFPA